MSWMGAPWDQEWSPGGGDEQRENPVKQLSHLRRWSPIELSTRYTAIEPEEDDDESNK